MTNEDGDDYIYLAEKLRTLSGKKLQSKRNLVNRFQAAYEGRWSYEDMTRDNIRDAFGYHIRWCNQNGCAQSRDFQGETCAIVQALHNFDALDLRGGAAASGRRGDCLHLWLQGRARTCMWCRLKRPTIRFRALIK